MVPEDIGVAAARMLLEEVRRGGVVDGAHQGMELSCDPAHTRMCMGCSGTIRYSKAIRCAVNVQLLNGLVPSMPCSHLIFYWMPKP